MTANSWRHFSTAPLIIKFLSFITAVGTLFFIFHTAVQFIYEKEIDSGTYYIATWTQELYLNLWMALPLFLAIIGTTIHDKRVNKWLIVFVCIFGIGHLLNIGNAQEWVDIPHLQYPQSIALIGILTVWIIHITKKKKSIPDILKFIWLFGLTYSFVIPRFVPSGHEAGNFFLASMFVFPIMMIYGLVLFFKKPKHSYEQTS